MSPSALDLEALLSQSSEAFVALDSSGDVVAWNRAAEAMLGWPRHEALGRSLADLIIPERFRDAHRRGLARYQATGETRIIGERLELLALRRDGVEFPVELIVSEGRPEHGAAFYAFLHDISDRKAAEEQLGLTVAIVEGSADAIVSATPAGRIETWNAAAERLYGYTAAEMVGQSVALLYPGDHVTSEPGIGERLLAGEPVSDQHTRQRRKDGTLVDVSVSIFPIPDAEGNVLRIAAIARDVSERVSSERQLRQAHERFLSAFANAPIGMALVAPDGRFLSVNRSLCRLVGRSADELLEVGFQAITHPDDLEADLELVRKLLAGEIRRYELEKRYLRPDGRVVWVLLAVSLVRDAAGEPLHFVSQMQDITARRSTEDHLREQTRRLQSLAQLDPVTGLANEARLRAAVAELEARGDRLAGLAILTIGDFDGLTARRGAGGSDRLVREVAAGIAASIREEDLAAHLDGPRFAVLVRGGADAAQTVVDRIREEVGRRLPGVLLAAGTARTGSGTVGTLLERASAALDVERDAAASKGPMPWTTDAIHSILALARSQLEMDVAWLSRVDGSQEVFELFDGDLASFGVQPGDRVPMSETYCSRMLAGEVPNLVRDVPAHPLVGRLPITRDAGVGAYVGLPVVLPGGELYGTLCCADHQRSDNLGDRDVSLMRFLAGLVAELLAHDEQATDYRRDELELSGIGALLAALDARDHYTGDHSKVVVELATAVARRLGLEERRVREIEQVAVLHDVGKVGIPDAVLQKQGKLDDAEWDLMREHPAIGERIVAATPTLRHLAPAVRAEHERWDGAGYPDGLAGEHIPIASRVVLACDAFHAMTSARPYRPAMSREEACAELRSCAGTQFDPSIVEALLEELAAYASRTANGKTPAIT